MAEPDPDYDRQQTEAFFDSRRQQTEFSAKDIYGQSVKDRFGLMAEDVAGVSRTTPDGSSPGEWFG
ncbi:MAG: hypothetical protein HQK60_12100 [Deltaproteobacteria bacterium]|nr:hypothetical protein [Deltaproteobacteria bacterium]